MSVSTTSVTSVHTARVRVPSAFLRHVRGQFLRRVALLLAITVACLLLFEYCLWGNVTQVVRHFPMFLMMLALAQPLQFFSRGPWNYAVNDDGVFLRDENSPLDRKGYPLLQWNSDSLIAITPTVWQGWPALSLSCRRTGFMGRKMVTLVYRPEDEDAAAQVLMPSLTARLRFKD